MFVDLIHAMFWSPPLQIFGMVCTFVYGFVFTLWLMIARRIVCFADKVLFKASVSATISLTACIYALYTMPFTESIVRNIWMLPAGAFLATLLVLAVDAQPQQEQERRTIKFVLARVCKQRPHRQRRQKWTRLFGQLLMFLK